MKIFQWERKNKKDSFLNQSPEKFISDIGDWIEIRILVNVIQRLKKETYVILVDVEGEFG